MALSNKRDLSETFVDDQSATLRNNWVGDWAKTYDGNFTKYYLGTYTAATKAGPSFTFSFVGTEAWLHGALNNTSLTQDGHFVSYPTAEYVVDGVPAGPQQPYYNSVGDIVYFDTQSLADGPHTVKVTVTSANQSNPFIVDYYVYVFVAGSNSTIYVTQTPSPSHKGRIGEIVVGVVAGLAILALLIIGLIYFMKRSRRNRMDMNQVDIFEKPNTVDMISDEYRPEPFTPGGSAITPLPGSSTQVWNSAGGSNWQAGSSFGQSGVGSLPSQHPHSDITTQPASSRKALIAARQGAGAQESIQLQDSGIRFGAHQEEVPAPPPKPVEVPPTYTLG